jgi:hypothetical protein
MGFTPLLVTAFSNQLELTDFLLLRGANPNLSTNGEALEGANAVAGRTTRHESSFRGFIEVTKRLLSGGADVHRSDKDGGDSSSSRHTEEAHSCDTAPDD